MSVSGYQPSYQGFPPSYQELYPPPYPGSPPPYQVAAAQKPPLPAATNPQTNRDTLAFERFQLMRTNPVIQLNPLDKLALITKHPKVYRQLQQLPLNTAKGEGLFETLHMYDKVDRALAPFPFSQKQLKTLLQKGTLQDTRTDDGHSGLYHLYAMLTTARAPGYDSRTLVQETVDILSKPDIITQKFGPLSPNIARQILLTRNYPGLNSAGIEPPAKPLTEADLNVDNSATCVASSLMCYMALKEPAELVRHLNQLTSPANAFLEKVRLSEISPDNPQEALDILREGKIPFYESAPGEVTVKVINPPAGVLRAIDSQRFPTGGQYRTAIETAYQSALTHLATHSYDPATDFRDSDVPGETSKGLTELEKTKKMETIIKENGGVETITYQAVANKANPAPGEEGNSYLYGYNRSFEQTTADILQSLRAKEPVIIGTTDTDKTGAIVTGHELTITGAYVDPGDNELKFVVADSDDNISGPVVHSARQLIPTIHHAGLPLRLARNINNEIAANSGGYLIPDHQDAINFKLLSREHGPMPVEEAYSEPGQPYGPLPAYTPQAFPNTPLPSYPTQVNAAQPFQPAINPFKAPPAMSAPQPTTINQPTGYTPFQKMNVPGVQQPLAFQRPVYTAVAAG